jgi:glutamyl-tRNA synthetase
MQVTHIVRGLEYISSTPKYLSLYDALEITPPVLICMPHIMAPGGKKKLGKRDGAKSVTEYRDEGILPEAMINFLATLGWNDGTKQEIFSIEEILQKFSFDRVQRSGANFDEQKLVWLNGQWIRKLDFEVLYSRCNNYWPKSAVKFDEYYKKQVLKLAKDRLKVLADLPQLTSFFFTEPEPRPDLIKYDKSLGKVTPFTHVDLLKKTIKILEQSDFSREDIKNRLNNLLAASGQKPAILFSLIRVATTWSPYSPELFCSLSILGKQTVLDRLHKAIKLL